MKKLFLKFNNHLILVIIIIILSLPVILPYFHSGYFPTHDGEWAVVRLADMFRELHDKQIPPRYSGNLNFGYGYPLFNFTYPGPYFLGMIFYFLHLGFVNSIKTVFALTVPFSAIGMYLFSRKLWKSDLGGVISSILYIYFPYRIVDLYVRGSIGESVAFAVVPFLFYGLLKIRDGKNLSRWIAITAVLFSLLILSHNIMAVLFSIPLGTFILFTLYSKRDSGLFQIIALALGGFFSSFFMIPALAEKHNILLSKIPIADRSLYFVSIQKLLFSPWGYAVPTDPQGAFTYQIGIPQLTLFIIVIGLVLYYLVQKKKKKEANSVLMMFLLVTVGMSIFLFSPTLFIWQHTPLLSEINYPWTLLGPLGFLLAVIGGYLATRTKQLVWIAIAFTTLSVIIILPNAHPQYFVDRGDAFYVTNDATTTSSDELMPLWVKKFPTTRPENKIEFLNGNGLVSNVLYNSKQISASVLVMEKSQTRINEIYYPGWKAFVDGNEVSVSYKNENGLIHFPVESGNHSILLKFSETPLRLISDLITVMAGLVVILLFIWNLPVKFFNFVTSKNILKR